LPAAIGGQSSQIRLASSQNRPDRGLLSRPLFLVRHVQVVLNPASHVRGARLHAHDRVEIDIAIGQVESQHAAFGQLRSIEPEGLESEQMDGNGIRAEDVEHDELITLIRSFVQPESSIARNELERDTASATVRKVREEPQILGDPKDRRIKLIERPELPRPGETSQCARSQSHDRHVRARA